MINEIVKGITTQIVFQTKNPTGLAVDSSVYPLITAIIVNGVFTKIEGTSIAPVPDASNKNLQGTYVLRVPTDKLNPEDQVTVLVGTAVNNVPVSTLVSFKVISAITSIPYIDLG